MDVAAGLAYTKTGVDLPRLAIGLAKDARGVLPTGETKDAIGTLLLQAERQIKLAEARIARRLMAG